MTTAEKRSLPAKLLLGCLPALALFLVAEAGLRIAGYEGTTIADIQATAGFNDSWTRRRDRDLGPWLLVDDAPQPQVRTSPTYKPQGLHQVGFPLTKASDELRLFALGGSTTQGMPFDKREQGFPERTGKLLQQRRPEVRWRVVNMGVGGLDAHELPRQVDQIMDLSPDGLLIYTGNNELVGSLVHQCSDPFRTGVERWANEIKLLRLGRSLYRATKSHHEILAGAQLQRHQTQCAREEVARILAKDAQRAASCGGSLEDCSTAGDEPWQPRWPQRSDNFYLQVLDDYHRVLEQVIERATDDGVEVWLALPPLNYLAAPHHGTASMDRPQSVQKRIEDRLGLARHSAQRGDHARAITLLEEALAADPTHAEVCYLLGSLLLETGDASRAKLLLQRAADRDYEGNRITSGMSAVLATLCHEHPEIHCVDLRSSFEEASPDGIPRDDLFVDFCHPTFEAGVDLLATGFADEIESWYQTRTR